MSKFQHRPDIDGLRAIAVLAVVFFHAFPAWVKGGYIGVDIFFVISGYLIAKNTYEEVDNKRFSLTKFYARRIRRITPALLLILIACLVLGWFALFNEEYKSIGKYVAAAAGFISNIVLLNDTGYFDSSAYLKPLLHLWSLAIEEQFYLFWPFLIFIAYRNQRFFEILIFLTSISFFLNLILIAINVEATFYLPITRIWEIIAGSLLAWVTHKSSRPLLACFDGNSVSRMGSKLNKKNWTINFASILGLMLLLFSFYKFDTSLPYPGVFAIFPVFGTLLLIWSSENAWVNRVILSNKLLCWVGLISYPLYLWHWPILSFASILEGEFPSRALRISSIFFSIFLSWATYFYIEKKVRSYRISVSAPILLGMLLSVGLIGCFIYLTDGASSRDSMKTFKSEYNSEKKIFQNIENSSCKSILGISYDKDVYCEVKAPNPRVLIVGDSHARALNAASFREEINLSMMMIGIPSCVPLVGYKLITKGVENKLCNELPKMINDLLTKFKSIDTIIVATRGPHYFTGSGYGQEGQNSISIVSSDGKLERQEDMFMNGYINFLNYIRSEDKKIIFVTQVPEIGEDPEYCLRKRPLQITFSDCSQSLDKVLQRQRNYREIIKEIQISYPLLKIYDPIDIFCDTGKCYGKRDDKLLYWDNNHITTKASVLMLNDMINRKIIEVEKK